LRLSSMIVMLKDAGSRLKIWARRSTRNLRIDLDLPDLTVCSPTMKKVALAMLRHYPAKVLALEEGRAVHLLVAVKVQKSALKALKALSAAEPIRGRKATEILKRPTPKAIMKALEQSIDL